MEKKVKKAYKIIKKYEKKLKKEREENDFRMYERPGCCKCCEGQIITGGATDLDVTYYERCKCSYKHTKQYDKFLKNKNKLMGTKTAKEFKIISDKWYDNNSHITVGNNSVDRSW